MMGAENSVFSCHRVSPPIQVYSGRLALSARLSLCNNSENRLSLRLGIGPISA